jgi:hypothetical protein
MTGPARTSSPDPGTAKTRCNSWPSPCVTITETYQVCAILMKSVGRIVEYSRLSCWYGHSWVTGCTATPIGLAVGIPMGV